MISNVFQSFQSYVEPPHVLSFQLFPNPHESCLSTMNNNVHKEDDEVEVNSTISIVTNKDEGWSFLEPFSNGIGKEDQIYVHPLSSSRLSKKSLEMCTESIGSESGSDIGDNDICLVTQEERDEYYGSSERASTRLQTKKTNRRDISFPPPLTSISGSTGVRVESHREDGRLVLRAVGISSYFHAERSHGRLKLQLVKDKAVSVKEEEEEEEEAYWDSEEKKEKMRKDENGEEEIRRDNFGRPCRCRCKEGRHEGKELLNWEPLWIST